MRRVEELACFAILTTLLVGAKATRTDLKQWTESQPLGDAGALYLSVTPKDFPAGETAEIVSIDLYDDDNRQLLTISHAVGKNLGNINEIWQAKPGLYRLVRIRYGDRTWLKWKNSKLVLIRSGELSNLGRWFLKPSRKESLAVGLRRNASKYRFGNNSPFHAVIDGFGGKTQVVKKGHHAGKLARRGPGGTYVASFSYYRHVALSYDIEVNRSQHAAPLLSRIDSDRSLFQQCYTEQVNGERSGKVRFRFALDPRSNRLNGLKLVHSDLSHQALENCLNNQLGAIQYGSSQDLKGTITFNFEVGQQTL